MACKQIITNIPTLNWTILLPTAPSEFVNISDIYYVLFALWKSLSTLAYVCWLWYKSPNYILAIMVLILVAAVGPKHTLPSVIPSTQTPKGFRQQWAFNNTISYSLSQSIAAVSSHAKNEFIAVFPPVFDIDLFIWLRLVNDIPCWPRWTFRMNTNTSLRSIPRVNCCPRPQTIRSSRT